MSEYSNIFKLVDSNYLGEKSAVLDIGTKNCSLINQFLINGYTDLTAIDKARIDIYSCFLNFKISKNEISEYDYQTFILHDREEAKLNKNQIIAETKSFYEFELNKYYESIQFYNGSLGDFFNFPEAKKFNIILSSYVFHLYPPEKDKTIINKLKKLSSNNGLIYIKVHNLERAKTLDLTYEIDGAIIKKNGRCTGFLFNNSRLDIYKNEFVLLNENIFMDKTELLLRNNNSTV